MANTDVNDTGTRGGALRMAAWAVAPLLILLVPSFAMIFRVEGWDWSPPDFVFMAALLGGGGLCYALATTRVGKPLHRLAMGLGLLALVLVAYVDAAVGIIGILGGS